MVVNVSFFLCLAHERASAMPAADEPGKGEGVSDLPVLLQVPSIEKFLAPLPGVFRHQGVVNPCIDCSIVLGFVGINTLSQDFVQRGNGEVVLACAKTESIFVC